ncbi:MAG: PAS domain S-box protein [Frankiaceae bacterium]
MRGPFAIRKLLDSLAQAVIATDLTGRVEHWNAEAERLYGWTAAEAVGRPATAFLVPHVPRRLGEEIMRTILAGRQWSGGLTMQRKDGSTFPALVTSAGIYHDGELVGIVGASTDLGHALQPLLARSPDATLILNADGRIAYVSPAAAGSFGWTDAALGEPLWALIHPDDRLSLIGVQGLIAVASAAYPVIECRVARANGSWCWVDLLLINCLHAPAIRGLVCNLRDITERIADREQRNVLIEQLQTALTSRVEIEQAKGFIAAQSGGDVGEAFAALRRYARDNNLRLHDVAHRIVTRDLQLPRTRDGGEQ